MARETGPSLRTTRTSTSFQQKRKGMNRTRRRNITSAGPGGEIAITITPRADCMVIENIGSNEIRFVFNGDSFAQHWSLAVGARSPEFAVNKNTEVQVRCNGGAGAIQYMLWG